MNVTEEYIRAVDTMREVNRVIEEFDFKCGKEGYTCTEEAWDILWMVQNLALSFLDMEEASER